jgi:hypothetical protein
MQLEFSFFRPNRNESQSLCLELFKVSSLRILSPLKVRKKTASPYTVTMSISPFTLEQFNIAFYIRRQDREDRGMRQTETAKEIKP